ncbi:MAG: hypothetical protein JW894_14285 [Bacteroidales bacterium]|nr:hypothetical protein [Bacteroidales bacterium]
MIKAEKLKFIILAGIIVTSSLSESVLGQRWKLRRYEVGGGLGITQVFGDIGGTIDESNWLGLKDIQISETNLAVPLYLRYKLDPVYSIKFNTVLGFGRGDDKNSRNDRGREYKTMLLEFSVQGEYYFLSEEKRYKSAAMFNKRGMLNNYASFGAYGFIGVGGVYSKSTITYTTSDPAPSDDVKPNNFGVVFPVGLGIKYIIDDRWLINGELGYRISVTDYIEGFSQLEYSKRNDVYYFLTFNVGYRLETSRRGLPSVFDKEYRKARSATRRSRVRSQPRSKRGALK